MASPDKVAAVAEIREKFENSSAALVTAYTGLTVAQLKELRRSLGENAQYRVAKNTLTKIAANEAGVTGLDEFFTGSTAVAFVTGDPVETAKGLRDFAKDNPALVIKGGVLDGKSLSAEEIVTLADLEPREVLLAKLAGGMKASMAKAAATFQAPLSQFARTADALREKVEQQSGAAAAE
jgi:large subunit ribosomal protein L10